MLPPQQPKVKSAAFDIEYGCRFIGSGGYFNAEMKSLREQSKSYYICCNYYGASAQGGWMLMKLINRTFSSFAALAFDAALTEK